MATTENRIYDDGDAVLTAFVQAGATAELSDWARRYPKHARDLARMAERRWAEETRSRVFVAADATAEARVLGIGRAVLEATRASLPRNAPQLASLVDAARAQGLEPEQVAVRLELPESCFWKLHRRLFAPDSVPRSLVSALANLLQRQADEVSAYLQQPPTLAAGARYRAETAPQVGEREEFAAALRADTEATSAQRARWLDPDRK